MTTPPTAPPALRRVIAALFVGYALWYGWLALGESLPRVVNGLLDDSFYYLQVARNVARGLGSTFDGIEPTNGYHPLWMLLLVPVAALTGGDGEWTVRAAVLLGGVLGLCAMWLLRATLLRHAGPWAAVVGLLLFAWPRFFGQTVGLLETGLVLVFYLALAARMAVDLASPLKPWTLRRAMTHGLLLGGACLARLDSVFLLAAYGLWAVGEGWRAAAPRNGVAATQALPSFARALVLRLLPLPVAVVVVAPYLAWNLTVFGHLQPVSSAMKSSFPVLGWNGQWLRSFPEFSVLLLLGAAFAVWGLRRDAAPLVRTLGVFGVAALLHMAYLVLFMVWGVDRWYFTLLFPVGLLGLPWLARGALESLGRRRAFAFAMLAAGGIGAIAVQTVALHLRDQRYLAGTAELARWAAVNLPADAVLAATDSGVLAWFSERTTINLDGLINNWRYRDALRAGRLEGYLRERGVTHILDQYNAGRREWYEGTYDSRRIRIWFRPERRVAGEIEVFRSDEARRINLWARMAPGQAAEPNALILWRYRPPGGQSRATPR